jgi:hypothetical protein
LEETRNAPKILDLIGICYGDEFSNLWEGYNDERRVVLVVVDRERERERINIQTKDSEEFNTGPLWKLRSRSRTWAG